MDDAARAVKREESRPSLGRRAQVNGVWLAFLASIAVFLGLVGLLVWDARQPEQESLLLYCAASQKGPVARVAAQYEAECGVRVELIAGGSETLLASLALSQRGDLYLPADDSYLTKARARELIDEELSLAIMTPVLAVARGNPRRLHSLQDVLDQRASLAQADPDAAAIGLVTRRALQPTARWVPLQRATRVFKSNVNEVANDVKIGAVEAGIVWDALRVPYRDSLDFVPIPELSEARGRVRVAVLRSSTNPTAALRFARYLSAPNRGMITFAEFGFQTVDGDEWHAEPIPFRVHVAPAMASIVRSLLADFARREEVPEHALQVQVLEDDALVHQIAQGLSCDVVVVANRVTLDRVQAQLTGEPLSPFARQPAPGLAIPVTTPQRQRSERFLRWLQSPLAQTRWEEAGFKRKVELP